MSAPVKVPDTVAEFRILCAWCTAVIQEGPPGAPVSHGCCNSCFDKQMRQIDEIHK